MVKPAQETANTTPAEIRDGMSDGELAQIGSISDVLTMTGGNVANIADVLGDGFSVCEDKMAVINKGFVVVKYGRHSSEVTGKDFSTLHVVTESGEKLIINDGSTGIHRQLTEMVEQYGRVCPLYVPRGLRVSEFDYKDEKTGTTKKAKTFYLSTSK